MNTLSPCLLISLSNNWDYKYISSTFRVGYYKRIGQLIWMHSAKYKITPQWHGVKLLIKAEEGQGNFDLLMLLRHPLALVTFAGCKPQTCYNWFCQ